MSGGELYKALLAAQESAKGLSKDGQNSFGKFGYTSIEEVVKTCRQILHGKGLVFFPQFQKMCVTNDVVYVEQEYCLMHPASGESQSISRTMVVAEQKGQHPCQAQGSAESYLLKNTLRELLLLPRFDKNEEIDAADNRERNSSPRRQYSRR